MFVTCHWRFRALRINAKVPYNAFVGHSSLNRQGTTYATYDNKQADYQKNRQRLLCIYKEVNLWIASYQVENSKDEQGVYQHTTGLALQH